MTDDKVWTVAELLRAYEEGQIRPDPLPAAQRQILVRLREAPDGLDVRALAEALGMSAPRVRGLLREMRWEGWVCPEARRTRKPGRPPRIWKITDRGRDRLAFDEQHFQEEKP